MSMFSPVFFGGIRAPLRSALAGVLAASLLSGCSLLPSRPAFERPDAVSLFSQATPGEPHPLTWQPMIITRFNKLTEYTIVDHDGERVLRARAAKSASGLVQDVAIDPQRYAIVFWRWKAMNALPEANLARAGMDDSPARLIVGFDGPLEKLDIEDRAMASMVKLISGREMPYASLIYAWDGKLRPGTVIDNPHSSRAKIIIVESGEANVGQWRSFRRNIVEDFRRAFGEAPGKIFSVAVGTDTNRTESDAVTYYGDIRVNAD
jgi:hypothetical protein